MVGKIVQSTILPKLIGKVIKEFNDERYLILVQGHYVCGHKEYWR